MLKNMLIFALIWLLLACTFSDRVRAGISVFIAKALFFYSEAMQENSERNANEEAKGQMIFVKEFEL